MAGKRRKSNSGLLVFSRKTGSRDFAEISARWRAKGYRLFRFEEGWVAAKRDTKGRLIAVNPADGSRATGKVAEKAREII